MTLRKFITNLVRQKTLSRFRNTLKQIEDAFLKTDEQKIDIGLNIIEKVSEKDEK